MALSTNETNAATIFMSLPDQEIHETTRSLPLKQLHEYQRHAFKVRMNADMAALVESIRENGVIEPILVRRDQERGGFEIIAGHRRSKASELAGLETIPCIIRDIDDDTADILMADSNLKREEIGIGERAWAYRIKLEAMKRQGKRNDLTSAQIEPKLISSRSNEQLAAELGESRAKIQRYIRLTYLIPELMDIVDAEDMPIGAGVAISYLTQAQQQLVHSQLTLLKRKLTLAQAEMIRQSAQGIDDLNENVVRDILLGISIRHPTLSPMPPKAEKSMNENPIEVPKSTSAQIEPKLERSNEPPMQSFVNVFECQCISCTCTGCHEECYGHCQGCGNKTTDCNSYQTEGEKRRSDQQAASVEATESSTERTAIQRALAATTELMILAKNSDISDKAKQHLYTAHAELMKYKSAAGLFKNEEE